MKRLYVWEVTYVPGMQIGCERGVCTMAVITSRAYIPDAIEECKSALRNPVDGARSQYLAYENVYGVKMLHSVLYFSATGN